MVGLVEDRHGHAVEDDAVALHQVDEAPGRGDDDVHAALQLGDLPVDRRAADDDQGAQADQLGQRAQRVLDLLRELASGQQHEAAAPLGPASRLARRQAGDHRQAEGQRLARAGLRAAQHVAAGQGVGHGQRLDGCGRLDALGRQRGDDGRGERELGEAAGAGGSRGGRGRRRSLSVGRRWGGSRTSGAPARWWWAQALCVLRLAGGAGAAAVAPGSLGGRGGHRGSHRVPSDGRPGPAAVRFETGPAIMGPRGRLARRSAARNAADRPRYTP